MPKIVRIDNVTTDPAGKVVVEFSASNGILGAPGGQSIVYDSLQAFRDRIAQFESEITDEQLMLIAASQWLKADSQLANKLLAKNKTAQLDLTGNQAVVKLA